MTRWGLALLLVWLQLGVAGCGTSLWPGSKSSSQEAPAPSPSGASASPAPVSGGAERTGAGGAVPREVTDQLSRLASDIVELQGAVARLVATQRQQDDQLQLLQRRLNELGAQSRNQTPPAPPGFAPTPGSQAPRAATPPSITTPPDEIYRSGLAKFRDGDLDASLITFYELISNYPTHRLVENAHFWAGEIFYRQKDYRGALTEFENVLSGFPRGSKTPDALLKVGLCQRALGNEALARKVWERLMREHPTSPPARQARALLRGDRG